MAIMPSLKFDRANAVRRGDASDESTDAVDAATPCRGITSALPVSVS